MGTEHAEYVVVTQAVPGLDAARERMPARWRVWVNPDEHPLPRERLLDLVEDCTGLLVLGEKVDDELLGRAPRLRAIAKYGVGVDNIDLDAARRRGVAVVNLPTAVTYSTAELTIGLLLDCARRLSEADRWVRANNPYVWSPSNLMGTELRGKQLGLIGFGRIGQRVAEIARAFEMRIGYHARTRRPEAEERLGASYHDLATLLSGSDAISLHLPATAATHGLIGRDEFRLMKDRCILVNTARGTVVDESALVEALRRGEIAAAGLDVFQHEPNITPDLCRLENVVLTPHVGTSTWETRHEMTDASIASLVAVLAGEDVADRVV